MLPSSNYDSLTSLEAGDGPGGSGGRSTRYNRNDVSYSDNPAFETLHAELATRLKDLRHNISKLATDVGLLGTKRDTARVRERTHDLLQKGTAMCKEIGEGVKKLQTWEDLSRQQKGEQSRISSDFQALLKEFQELQRRALNRQHAAVSAARTAQDVEAHNLAIEDEITGGQFQQQQQQQQQPQQQQQQEQRLANQDEVDFQETLIVQREEEIRAIEQGVSDLNVLFRQVAQIVNEQGETLYSIADRVETVRDDTRAAERENRQAARYQRAARNKSFCLLIVLSVIAAIVLLAIFLG